jgi:hypothetical protein
MVEGNGVENGVEGEDRKGGRGGTGQGNGTGMGMGIGYRWLCLGVEDCCDSDFISSQFLCNLLEATVTSGKRGSSYVSFFVFFASKSCSEMEGNLSSTVL